MSTGLIYHPIFLKHDTGLGHPERPSRIQAILRKLERTKLIDRLKLIEPEPASIDTVALVHSREYILNIKDMCSRLGSEAKNSTSARTILGNSDSDSVEHGYSSSGVLSEAKDEVEKYIFLDPDTPICKDSFDAALYAVGAVTKAVDLIFSREIDNAFCLVRPPGHHARPEQAMGFCLFNNVAIGAQYVQKKYGITRIAIIDWDAHHGNGTEEIFYEDPGIFYISLHQYPHYPGTGEKEAIGNGKGKGSNLNIPMQTGSGDEEYVKAFYDSIIPRLKDYKPEFILISAGFDSHADDPLSSLSLTENGYRKMTELLKDIANQCTHNRIISVLEGGYNLVALADSVNAHIEALI